MTRYVKFAFGKSGNFNPGNRFNMAASRVPPLHTHNVMIPMASQDSPVTSQGFPSRATPGYNHVNIAHNASVPNMEHKEVNNNNATWLAPDDLQMTL